MKYHFKVHKEKKGYWAECVELEGLRTQGDNMEDLKANMSEALDLYLSEPEDSKHIFLAPKKNVPNAVKVPVSSNVAFSVEIRQLRLKAGKTQAEMAEALHFKNLFSYQRLETPKSNPTLETLTAIKKEFPSFDLSKILD